MAHFIYAARNCRKRHSTKAEGDKSNKIQLSPDYMASKEDTALNPTQMAAMAAELRDKARLKTDNAVLAVNLMAAYAAEPAVADTVTFEERVGKGIMQLGYGTGATAAEAKANIVWFNLS